MCINVSVCAYLHESLHSCVCEAKVTKKQEDGMPIKRTEKQAQYVDFCFYPIVFHLYFSLIKKSIPLISLSVMLVCVNGSCQCWKSVDLCACPGVHAWICNLSSASPHWLFFPSPF